MSLVPSEATPVGSPRVLLLSPSYTTAREEDDILGNQPGLENITDPIEIGLINNMPDAALEATERQFLSLLAGSAAHIDVRVHFFALADVPRGERAERHLALCYDDLEALLKSRLDALIITGNEPKAARLSDEPYWNSLARLFDWAEQNTLSTLFSCLSAHAALLHYDGIERLRLTNKCSGLFDHDWCTDHPLTAGFGDHWPVAHSRWNGIPEATLKAAGYTVLSRSEAAGANLFVRQRHSLLVLFQGHPEYDPDSLFKEYRRDVRRFLLNEQTYYPDIPEGCLKAATRCELHNFRERALARRSIELMEQFPEKVHLENVRLTRAKRGAMALFQNWLQAIAAAKQRRWRAELVSPAVS